MVSKVCDTLHYTYIYLLLFRIYFATHTQLSYIYIQYIRNTNFPGTDPKICCELRTDIDNVLDRFVNVNTERSRIRSTTTTTTASPTDATVVDRHPNLKLLDHKLCGYVAPELKIYGGSETKVFEFPWMALLAFDSGQTNGQPDFRCGATIVNRNYVLTAAHCVTNLPESELLYFMWIYIYIS